MVDATRRHWEQSQTLLRARLAGSAAAGDAPAGQRSVGGSTGGLIEVGGRPWIMNPLINPGPPGLLG
jgi:hypothetical protein